MEITDDCLILFHALDNFLLPPPLQNIKKVLLCSNFGRVGGGYTACSSGSCISLHQCKESSTERRPAGIPGSTSPLKPIAVCLFIPAESLDHRSKLPALLVASLPFPPSPPAPVPSDISPTVWLASRTIKKEAHSSSPTPRKAAAMISLIFPTNKNALEIQSKSCPHMYWLTCFTQTQHTSPTLAASAASFSMTQQEAEQQNLGFGAEIRSRNIQQDNVGNSLGGGSYFPFPLLYDLSHHYLQLILCHYHCAATPVTKTSFTFHFTSMMAQ